VSRVVFEKENSKSFIIILYWTFKTHGESELPGIHTPMSVTVFKPRKDARDPEMDARLTYESGKRPWVMHSFTRFYDVSMYGVDLVDGTRFRVGWTRHESNAAFMDSLVRAQEDGKITSMIFWEKWHRLVMIFRNPVELAGYKDVKKVIFHYHDE
jgi:hypothetical protein